MSLQDVVSFSCAVFCRHCCSCFFSMVAGRTTLMSCSPLRPSGGEMRRRHPAGSLMLSAEGVVCSVTGLVVVVVRGVTELWRCPRRFPSEAGVMQLSPRDRRQMKLLSRPRVDTKLCLIWHYKIHRSREEAQERWSNGGPSMAKTTMPGILPGKMHF